MAASVDESDVQMPNIGGSSRRAGRRDLRNCSLQAVLPGFTSQAVELSGKMSDIGSADVGRIVLHRVGEVGGFTISATSAAAPPAARKEYEKGKEQAQKGKWDSALTRLTKAVEIYPKYAVAWFELGRVQIQKGDTVGAKNSFLRALAADSKFISPYGELAQLAAKEKDWKALAEDSERLLALNPVSYPQFWFYNSAANYYLGELDKAEKSAARCIALDEQHRIPRIEYVLGMILAKKKDYSGAAAHIRNYVRLAPNAPDLEFAQKQIAELEMSAALVQSPSK